MRREFEVNGKKFVVENGTITINGKVAHTGVKDTQIVSLNENNKVVTLMREAVLKAGLELEGRVMLMGAKAGNICIMREIAEEAARQYKACLSANEPESIIEGLQELRDAIAATSKYAIFTKITGDDSASSRPRLLDPKVQALEKDYPRAAAYIEAEQYAQAEDIVKWAAAKKAMKQILAGEDYEAVLKELKG